MLAPVWVIGGNCASGLLFESFEQPVKSVNNSTVIRFFILNCFKVTNNLLFEGNHYCFAYFIPHSKNAEILHKEWSLGKSILSTLKKFTVGSKRTCSGICPKRTELKFYNPNITENNYNKISSLFFIFLNKD